MNKARTEIKKRRRVAKTGKSKAGDRPDGDGQLAGTGVVRVSQRKRGCWHLADVSSHSSSRFYNPAQTIAERIQAALDPDDATHKVHEVEQTGTLGAGRTTRGHVIETSERGGCRVFVYGRKIWLKAVWVTDLGGGKLHIQHGAYAKSRLLNMARKKREKQRAELLARQHSKA